MAISAATWTQIGGGIVAAVIVALQGANLNETSNVVETGQKIVATGEKRTTLLEEILDISKNMDQGLRNQTEILRNEVSMMASDDRSLKMQGEILNTIKEAISARQELLEHQLQEMREKDRYYPHGSAPTPNPSPSP
jgi:small-conductance mechanosensitive channel